MAEKIYYLDPKLKPILKNIWGHSYPRPSFEIARHFAGFTYSEADILRKAVGKKIKNLLDEQKEKFIKGAIKQGASEKTAQLVWDFIEPFARYGFNRAHAACYAMIAYRTAYLRTLYPVEFYASLFNADSGDVDRIAVLISEAKKARISVLPPDVNRSVSTFVPEEKNIRFGLLAIKNLGQNIVEAIIAERQKGGPFKNFSELLSRVEHKDLNKKSLESLLKSGALDSLGIERNSGLMNIDEILKFASNVRKSKQATSQTSLFSRTISSNALKLKPFEPALQKDKLNWEKELLGLYISDHPLSGHREILKKHEVMEIKTLLTKPTDEYGPKPKIAGVISKIQRVMTKLGQPMLFAQVQDFNDSMEVMVFANTLEKTLPIWQENKLVMVSGKMTWRNNEPKFICDNVKEI